MYAEILIETGIVGMVFYLQFVFAIRRQLLGSAKEAEKAGIFYQTLFKVLIIEFWMFALYSLNYWGLSQYYWYNLAGLVIAASILVENKATKRLA